MKTQTGTFFGANTPLWTKPPAKQGLAKVQSSELNQSPGLQPNLRAFSTSFFTTCQGLHLSSTPKRRPHGPKGPKPPGGRGRGRRRKRRKKQLPKAVVYIQSTQNNTIVTITNLRGTVVAWRSAGCCGFKGARKSTGYAAKKTATLAARQSASQGLNLVKVMVKGVGPGRKTAMRGLLKGGLHIAQIRDVTGIAHNGCRPPKKRRV